MSLQDKGYRFILRRRDDDGSVEGNWEHPANMSPGGFDATELDDDLLADAMFEMEDRP